MKKSENPNAFFPNKGRCETPQAVPRSQPAVRFKCSYTGPAWLVGSSMACRCTYAGAPSRMQVLHLLPGPPMESQKKSTCTCTCANANICRRTTFHTYIRAHACSCNCRCTYRCSCNLRSSMTLQVDLESRCTCVGVPNFAPNACDVLEVHLCLGL